MRNRAKIMQRLETVKISVLTDLGFTNILMTNDVTKGITTLIQVAGLGGLRHNTILLTWPKEWRKTYKTAQNVIIKNSYY